MGCGASKQPDDCVVVASMPMKSPRRERMSSVTFSVKNSPGGDGKGMDSPRGAADSPTTRRSSEGSFANFVERSDSVCSGAINCASFQGLDSNVVMALTSLSHALLVNERECERLRLELEAKLQKDAAAKASAAATNPSAILRDRRTTMQQQNTDRPSTPTGFVTEEPSAFSQNMKKTVDSIKKKFASFFGDSNAVQESSSDVVAPMSQQRVQMQPASKYNANAGTASKTGDSSANGSQTESADVGSLYQASVSLSMQQSLSSIGTRGSAVGEGQDEVVIDEKVIQRTKVWVDDTIAVTLRVFEIVRRRHLSVVEPKGVNTTPSESVDGLQSTTKDDGSQQNESQDGGTSDTASGNASHAGLMRSFVPTISLDPLAQKDDRRGSAHDSVSGGEGAVSARKEASPVVLAPGGPRKGASVLAAPVPTWSRTDNFLSKRNLDKLQEKIAAQSTGISPQLIATPHAGLGGGGQRNSMNETVQRSNDDENGRPRPLAQSNLQGTGSFHEARKRQLSRCDDNLLFQELV